VRETIRVQYIAPADIGNATIPKKTMLINTIWLSIRSGLASS
jgi:hypothetical protein